MLKLLFPLIISSFIFDKYLLFMIFTIFLTLYLIMLYPNIYPMMIENKFMFIDSLSMIMILLTIISSLLIIMSSSITNISFPLIFMIMIILFVCFSSMNIFMFYITFEMVLIPTLILITKAGPQPERLQAGIYLMLYTIMASLPLLIILLSLKTDPNFLVLNTLCMKSKYALFFILAFLVKMPMFFFHLWLPKAHVEAPMEGSMILAAVLLKLGGYGIIRFLPILIKSIYPINFWIISISLVGASITSMNCIRQKDLKSLIAYSSVAHMGLVLASLFTLNYIGLYGAIVMMIAHGLSSSALFMLVTMIYSKYHTRNIITFKGIMSSFPNLTFWFFIFIAMNMAAPPSINLMGEMLMMISIISHNYFSSLLIIIITMMTSIFSIALFVNSTHNLPNIMMCYYSYNKMFLSLFIHFIPVILIITKLDMFI